MTSVELRRKATELRDGVAKIVSAAEKENRELNEDEQVIVDGAFADADKFDRRAAVAEKIEAHAAESRQTQGRAGSAIEIGDRHPEGVEGESEAEKRKSFSHWLTCVDSVSDPRTPRDLNERSRDDLDNMYRSKFNRWDTPNRPKHIRQEARNLAMNSGSTGGYLMPEEFYGQLMKISAPQSIVRSNGAKVIPMAAETIVVPSLDQSTAQTAGSPPYFGGVVLTWSGESTSITETEPAFRQTKLTMGELTGYLPVGRTLLAKSAISLEPLIYELFGGAVAFAEDYAFLRGNGIGKPYGILNSPARIKTAARGSASAITFDNATSVWVRVLTESRARGVWVVSKGAEGAVLKMTGTANSVFFPTGVYTGNTADINAGATGVMLYMRPVIVTAKLPALDVDGDFDFFDFTKYLIGDGGPPEVASSDDYLFRTNERAFRIVHRVAGSPWLNAPITLEDGTTTNSPFVSLGV